MRVHNVLSIGSVKNEMNEKFDIIDEKFNQVDEKFNQALNNQDQVLKRLGNLETDNIMDAVAHR